MLDDVFPPISTHALREEGDAIEADDTLHLMKFLPTPSARRATKVWCFEPAIPYEFLPTPSARRATWLGYRVT